MNASGDQVGILADPEFTRLGVRDGGWTYATLTERFEEITTDYDLTRTDRYL